MNEDDFETFLEFYAENDNEKESADPLILPKNIPLKCRDSSDVGVKRHFTDAESVVSSQVINPYIESLLVANSSKPAVQFSEYENEQKRNNFLDDKCVTPQQFQGEEKSVDDSSQMLGVSKNFFKNGHCVLTQVFYVADDNEKETKKQAESTFNSRVITRKENEMIPLEDDIIEDEEDADFDLQTYCIKRNSKVLFSAFFPENEPVLQNFDGAASPNSCQSIAKTSFIQNANNFNNSRNFNSSALRSSSSYVPKSKSNDLLQNVQKGNMNAR